MAVSKRVRYEVLRRDNHACRYCGATAPDAKLTVDHVMPVALGGSDDPSNLVTACQPCNAGKASSAPDAPIVDDVKQDALRWGKAMEAAAKAALANLHKLWEKRDTFIGRWESWHTADGFYEIPDDWRTTVDQLGAAGLPIELLLESVDIAMSMRKVKDADKWRYMCGVAWQKVAKLQEAAQAIVGGKPSKSDENTRYFPYMEFVDQILRYIAGQLTDNNREVQRIASDALWHAMPRADEAWRTTIEPENEDGDPAWEMAEAATGVVVTRYGDALRMLASLPPSEPASTGGHQMIGKSKTDTAARFVEDFLMELGYVPGHAATVAGNLRGCVWAVGELKFDDDLDGEDERDATWRACIRSWVGEAAKELLGPQSEVA